VRITLLRTGGSKCLLNAFVFVLVGSSVLSADERSSNWVGQFDPCKRSSELLKHDHMDIGVWFNTSNPDLAIEFRRAMDFWAGVLEMSWHDQNTSDCSIQVIDGSPDLFARGKVIAARSQLTNRTNFHGWIAFNPGCPLNRTEMYLTAIHEFGHMLGLQHNPSAKSVMYFLDLDLEESLDEKDLACLAARHTLRITSATRSVGIPARGRPFQAASSDARHEPMSSDSMTH
jgi:Matrixin